MMKRILLLCLILLMIPNVIYAHFPDVPSSHWAYTPIMTMNEEGVIRGYPNGKFGPNDYITNEQAAALIARKLQLETPKRIAFHFKDVPVENPYYDDIIAATSNFLFPILNKDYFNPKKKLTRAEMTYVIAKAFELEHKKSYNFYDVKDHPYKDYIETLYSYGIVKGYPDGSFGPDKPVTRAEFATFMHRAIYLDENYKPEPLPKHRPYPSSKELIGYKPSNRFDENEINWIVQRLESFKYPMDTYVYDGVSISLYKPYETYKDTNISIWYNFTLDMIAINIYGKYTSTERAIIHDFLKLYFPRSHGEVMRLIDKRQNGKLIEGVYDGRKLMIGAARGSNTPIIQFGFLK